MDLYLQFGWGMMDHCRSLISQWGGGTVILSPRDLEPQQLPAFANQINRLRGGRVLLDPQFYMPDADHLRLVRHQYWPPNYQTGLFWQGTPLSTLLNSLQALNVQCGCQDFILPGRLADEIDDDWLTIQELTITEARSIQDGLNLMPTIALSADATRNEDQIAHLLERTTAWNVPAYYLVCEHPRGNYLVDDPSWLANVLDLTAGLRLSGARVVLGYCSHQMLIAAVAKATAIASGTWLNVRSFPPEKFRDAVEEPKRKATWYYAPDTLSEYKIPALDLARTSGILRLLEPSPDVNGGYSDALFSGAQPSTIGLDEPTAFRHYLTCLRNQARIIEGATFDDAVARQDQMLNEAEARLATLSAARIRSQFRDFSEIIEVNRGALGSLIARRGGILRYQWPTL